MGPDVVTVAVTRSDGGVTVLRVIETSYAPDGTVVRHVEVTPEYVDYQISRYVNDGHWTGPLAPVSWRFVANEYLDDSNDQYFRAAWKDSGQGKPEVDMPKARDVHRDVLRAMRAPKFEALDVLYVKADERADVLAKQQIAADKQVLRDAPADPRIDAAQTPEELKAVVPEVLLG